ncbi:ribonuclease 3-like [Lycium barbarum]|uniref:ribonuclease 3-like n=1 Tax=Lycium barbarum TaxID=112863 RepID=UPI00293F5EEA|nr:ribonuclease 3-like [Lycium barbarum]
MKLIILVFLIVTNPVVVTSEDDYHYMAYVIQWLPTVCGYPGVNCKANIMKEPLRFTLHGLWPGNSTGGSLECNPPPHGTQDKVKEVWKNSKTLEKELHKYWPSLLSGWTDEEFWMHEWKAHGYCTKQTLPAADYFRAAVRNGVFLMEVIKALQGAKMVSDVATSDMKDIRAVLHSMGLSPNPYISCIPKDETHVYLKEIHFCLDKTLRRFIPCPTSQDTRGCGGSNKQQNVMIPSRVIL